MTECIQQNFGFQALGTRKVKADFRGGNLSGDGGVILLREVDGQSGMINQLADCFTDFRSQRWVEHSVSELLRQRIFGMAMGYEDLNDHDSLRFDPVMAVGVGKPDPLGLQRRGENQGKALAGKSTLNRLELTNAKTSGCEVIEEGAHKIRANFDAIEAMLIRFSVSQLSEDTEVLPKRVWQQSSTNRGVFERVSSCHVSYAFNILAPPITSWLGGVAVKISFGTTVTGNAF